MPDKNKPAPKANPAIVMNGRITAPANAAALVSSGKARPATQTDVARAGVVISAGSLTAAAALGEKMAAAKRAKDTPAAAEASKKASTKPAS